MRRGYLPPVECAQLKAGMLACQIYRQYTFGIHPEPRVHVLLGAPGTGYRYHGISMKAYPPAAVPAVSALADRTSRDYNGGRAWTVCFSYFLFCM